VWQQAPPAVQGKEIARNADRYRQAEMLDFIRCSSCEKRITCAGRGQIISSAMIFFFFFARRGFIRRLRMALSGIGRQRAGR